jgi:phosphatidylglycerol---prolipoprotein diacylglyceryl transferase
MVAALPYIQVPTLELGPIDVRPFGVLLALGVLAGAHAVRYLGQGDGLDRTTLQSMTAWTLIGGFLFAHVFDVLLYQSDVLLTAPWMLLVPCAGTSSVGGMLGGIGAFVLYFRLYGGPQPQRLRYADAAMLGAVIGYLCGRAGCAVVHDHPGVPSDFVLAVAFPNGTVRHDLGLYEFLWLVVVAIAVFATWFLYRRRRPGFIVGLTALLYAPVRFGLDFLRAGEDLRGGDPRYLGLTPAQYVAIALTALGLYLVGRALTQAAPSSSDSGDPG